MIRLPNRKASCSWLAPLRTMSRRAAVASIAFLSSRVTLLLTSAFSLQSRNAPVSGPDTQRTAADPDPQTFYEHNACTADDSFLLMVSILLWNPSVVPLDQVKRHIRAICPDRLDKIPGSANRLSRDCFNQSRDRGSGPVMDREPSPSADNVLVDAMEFFAGVVVDLDSAAML